MKNRSTLIITLETVAWIAASLLARHQLDLAAQRWNIQALWLFLLKIVLVLALMGAAVALHGLLVRLLVRLGWLPAEKKME